MPSKAASVTLALFIVSQFFVIQPVKIPMGRKRHFTLNLLTVPIIIIAILWALQCIGATTVRDGIVGTGGIKPYNILILFFSLAYMSITLDVTGVLKAAAHWVSNVSGESGTRLYVNFYIMVTICSAFLGNDPVILSGTMFLLYYTDATGLDSLPWLMTEFAAANTASMVLFVGNPTNVVICEGFGIEDAVFTAYTILPFIACSVTCLLALFLQYRTTKQLKPKLNKAPFFDISQDINDKVGAIVGSALLGCCLVTVLVVSFLNVDVWMVTLPFACAKFVFDVFWDLHRTAGVGNRNELLPSKTSSGSSSMHEKDTVGKETTERAYQDIKRTPSILVPQVKSSLSFELFGTAWNKQIHSLQTCIEARQPTLYAAFPRLPFALVPFAFSQFILIEALVRQGWIDIFASWLAVISRDRMFPTIWIVGVIGVVLCNIAGTNIGATIMVTKVVRAANLSAQNTRAAGIALALASNIGALSFVFSASLAGLLWKGIIDAHCDKTGKDRVTQWTFAKWNLIPLLIMTSVGLAVVSAEMAILYR